MDGVNNNSYHFSIIIATMIKNCLILKSESCDYDFINMSDLNFVFAPMLKTVAKYQFKV